MNNKKFWVINEKGQLELRDLLNESKNFTIDKYYKGEVDSYNFIYHEMFNNFQYDDLGCDYERYGCFIKPDDIVLDIGANVGIFSHRAESRGASKIIAFEPILNTFQCLFLNKTDKMDIYNLGVCDKNEFREFKIHSSLSNTGGGQHDINNVLESKGLNIVYNKLSYCININNIFNFYKIDFLKMDIEGGEVDVLNQISDENLNSIRCFASEFHNNSENFDLFQSNFLNRLNKLGFDHFTLYHGDGFLRTITAWKR